MTRAPQGPAPFAIDWTMLGLLAAFVLVAVLWWRLHGHAWMLAHCRFCLGCKRWADTCSCPVEWVFTPWSELSEEEKDDAL